MPHTTNIFINENLMQIRKKLVWKTKQLAKKENWNYFWTFNGNILFVRKSSNENSNVVAIKSERDLALIK